MRETVADLKTKYKETAHVVVLHFHVRLERFAGCYPSRKITVILRHW